MSDTQSLHDRPDPVASPYSKSNYAGAIFLVTLLVLTGCGASSGVVEESAPIPEPEELVVLADYETFDVGRYRDQPAQVSSDVEHDVLDALMNSQADDGIIQEVQGFRIQVFSGTDQQEAITVEEALRSRLETLSDENLDELGITRRIQTYNVFIQPYYRVRVGDFVSQESARALTTWLERRFPGTFIVPDRVTIRR